MNDHTKQRKEFVKMYESARAKLPCKRAYQSAEEKWLNKYGERRYIGWHSFRVAYSKYIKRRKKATNP